MKLSDIDLNLLVVFNQLLREGSVSRTAVALELSQPAVSNALRRLRDLLGDELFLRTPQGMAPTPYAQTLAEPVSQALQGLHHALNVRASFDPATSQRCYTLALTDVGEIYFLPVLMDALAREAPGVTLRCVPVATPALRDDMAGGQVDLALGWLPPVESGFMQQALFRQRYVALMRQGHPLAALPKVGAAAYRRANHVRVVSSGTGHAQVDQALDRLGMTGNVKLSVPHYVALGHVLASADLVATVPERLAERVGEPFHLVARPLTAKLPTSTICQLWHSHLHRDPGHQWLRGRIASLFGHPASA
ncbi:LysR family transcriptional regulator [Hydrogenophaga crassostreae]|uniref:LysR family transcriptional regulator n=1 Tax=Hydrogenophaga crassostreae TaxID=1763535 RepID=A0A167GMQ3_9BURK|nr:LysR family transcriptional regulator [Hydrogenophaga crassostreae]AOW14837.1 LysR family transcriptional regulator [Hydrogenophaga crassostreae]OAD39666.1 LysR family transcriptional regulator [Hydrogenophaga crassostreae]